MEERLVTAALQTTVTFPKIGASAPIKPAITTREAPQTHPFLEGREGIFKRCFEIAPAAITWFIISMLFWGGLVMPAPLALAVIAFDLYWFARSFSAAFHGIQGYWRVKTTDKIDWRDEYQKALDDGKVLVSWDDVHHVVIIPNYKELTEKLRATLDHLAAQADASWQMTVVLAMEAREIEAEEKAAGLEREYAESFAHIFSTLHPAGLKGEVPGKSSNEAWAARVAKQRLVDELGHDLENITITSCDADSLFHPRYFSCLTYKFCTDPRRHRRFWQAPIFQYNNIWEVPMAIRVVSVLSNVNFMAELCKGHGLAFPQSTYTLSLQMAHEVDYWDADVIPEDWHMFLKCFFRLGGEVNTEPIFLPVGSDAVHAADYWGSLVQRYKQAKRDAWGADDIGYAAREFVTHSEIPLWSRTRRMWALVENHLVWSTHWFILTLGGAVPVAMSKSLSEMGLHTFVSILLTACLGPFLIVIGIDALMRPRPPASVKWWFLPLSHLQWFLLPVTSAFFATLPALHAQTQLMLGKRLVYEVTEKV
jgi:hypothetical protein